MLTSGGEELGVGLSRLVDGLGRLWGEHLTLFRLELEEDVRGAIRPLTALALCVPLLFMGYALCCAGGVLLLAELLGVTAALFVFGIANLAVGCAGGAFVARRLGRLSLLGRSAAELQSSASTLSAWVAGRPKKVSGEAP